MAEPHLHQSHPEVVKRLKRAEGHLRSVIAMIEAGRPCLDIAQQLHAVEKAVGQAMRTLIQDHLEHCLDDVVGPLEHEEIGQTLSEHPDRHSDPAETGADDQHIGRGNRPLNLVGFLGRGWLRSRHWPNGR